MKDSEVISGPDQGESGPPEVRFIGDRLAIRFDRFGLPAYDLFLRAKKLPEYQVEFEPEAETYTILAPARFAGMLGVERPGTDRPDLPLSGFLFDDQRAIIRAALDAKRYAVWSDCGLGKSLIELEFGRQVQHRTGGRVLLVTLNEIVPQMLVEAARFYPDMPVRRIQSQAELIVWCRDGDPGLALTNYEKFNPKGLTSGVINECRLLSGIILDESSRLKGGGDSKQKKVINASCRGIEYKLSCTATPAPNDTLEFVSQATFLEKVRTETDIIWTYFVRDSKTHRRAVRAHARAAFFDFMASWSVYLKHPKRFGWRLDMPDVPEPEYHTHELPITPEQRSAAREFLSPSGGGSLFIERETNAIERVKLAQIARGFVYRKKVSGRGVEHAQYYSGLKGRRVERIPSRKPAFVADLIRREVADGHRTLVWTIFDEETAILSGLLDGANFKPEVLTGQTPEVERVAILERFRVGESRCLISRPRMLGYGMNFQFCTSMVFSGFSESFEDLYQAIRRAVRYGQMEPVRVHFVIVEELEGDTFANLKRKAAEHERSTAEMEDNYLRSFRNLHLTEIAVR